MSSHSDEVAVFSTKKQRTILLIEDNEVDRQMCRRYLNSDPNFQYTFIEAQLGKKALELYHQTPVDMVLLDYLLPDIDGLQWLNTWQKQTDKYCPPVIVLTGQGSDSIAMKFINLGAADYLVKDEMTAEKLQLSVNRVIAEVRLRAQFRNTFEQAAVGIGHLTPDGKWIKVNQKLCEIVGYSEEELLQKTFQDITHAKDLAPDLEYVRQILAGEIDSYTLEKRYIRKDNSLVWINLRVSLIRDNYQQPDYFIAVIEDISKRKQLEFSLQRSLRRLKNLYQIDKAILKAEDAQAVAEIAIDSIQKLVNCQRTSIVTFNCPKKTATILATAGKGNQSFGKGKTMSLTVWEKVIEKFNKTDNNYVIFSLDQFPQLSELCQALEKENLTRCISFPLKVRGKLLGIVKLWSEKIEEITAKDLDIVSEISDRVVIALEQTRLLQKTQSYALELEERVKQRTVQLEDINQELKAFSYSISHDLKAPLRAIQGFATAIQEDYSQDIDDLGQEYIKRLVNATQQMDKLIQDLLAYSRLSRTEIHTRPVELSGVVKQAMEQLKAEIEETQAQITIHEPLLAMIGNTTILVQVVSNLLSNAIKFVAPNVTPQIEIGSEWVDNNRVRWWIKDNGIGIECQHQDRIFRVFERLHGNESYLGTGIGLAIVKKAMERLGGCVGVESKPNQGSRFWIEGKRG